MKPFRQIELSLITLMCYQINLDIGYNIKCNSHTAFVGLLQDEIKVKEGLVYDSASDELIGYTDFDKTSNSLIDLENVFTNETRKLATSMLVVMVRGITTSLKYPFAAFTTLVVTADLLYNMIWNCVKTLEIDCGLKVLFVTCDGASPNRKFFGMHKEENSQLLTYFTWNTYATPRRKLFFISDVPHLMKTTRNCFANSSSHKLSRKLWKDGKNISWMHIVNLFEDYCETNLYRLTRAHVDLTAFSQMKVNLDVLGKTFADALEELYGDQVIETVKFIRHMNKFFDCLNVRSLSEGRKTRNRDRDIYCEADDDRLTYLMNDFLGYRYFDSWRVSVTNRPGDFTKGQRSSMMLSHQTLEGLQISV
ncbi:uncharacterized protein LOC124287470 [Haliotis rubra]|uniref:uncharacterized protein LOC124287470 n=1 Tax=Haliotis rubra TaxID=36100 RepID=UPI001EE4FF33|nr:uncharacterized protein LOC124287470 [Haliotis rubra]